MSEHLQAPTLMAWQFKYLAGFTDHNFETMPFYLKTLRLFLKNHLGKIVWIKGGIIEQPAYLIFYKELAEAVFETLLKPLKDGGRFGIIPIKKPIPIIRKYYHQERLCVGYLDLKVGKLGSISSLFKRPTDINYRDGFWLNNWLLIRSEDAYIKEHEGEPWVCFLNAVEIGVYHNGRISYTKEYPQLWIRKSDLKTQEEVDDVYGQRNSFSD